MKTIVGSKQINVRAQGLPEKFNLELIKGWPDQSKTQVKEILDLYGPPSETTDSMLIWHETGPWNRTWVYRDLIHHNWPASHTDILEQALSYKVPLDKFDDLAQYDGSVWAERTKGELVARCHLEPMNFVAINLAHAVITEAKTVQQARKSYEKLFLSVVGRKERPLESKKLMFKPVREEVARDPDKHTVRL